MTRSRSASAARSRPRRVLLAPDKFKETLSAREAAEAMAAGARRAGEEVGATVETDPCPVADGGEGTIDAMVAAAGGEVVRTEVTGPLGERVAARWGRLADGETAVVEIAEAAGLWRVPPDRRDPTRTTTRGAGELIRQAIDAGCRTIVVGLGGSATTDGGAGLAQGLGVRFFDASGREMTEPPTGGTLRRIARWEGVALDARLRVAADVTNPLLGPRGSAAVYGPQKGATPAQVRELDAALRHLASLADADPNTPGFGAAGGLGFGLVAFCGATLERGVDLVLDAVGFDERCARADLVLTGEGRLDASSISGKTTTGVARAAAGRGVPAIALVGELGEGWEGAVEPRGPLRRAIDLSSIFVGDRARREARACLEELARRATRAWLDPALDVREPNS